MLHSLNSGELAQRRFREIARVAGLVFTGYPGAPKSTKQLQASSSLFFEVFRKYDAGNLLLTQAQTEVLSQELDIDRLRATLQRMAGLSDRARRPEGAQPVQPAADGRALAREADAPRSSPTGWRASSAMPKRPPRKQAIGERRNGSVAPADNPSS